MGHPLSSAIRNFRFKHYSQTVAKDAKAAADAKAKISSAANAKATSAGA
jgi:hypothetical protein